MGTSILITSGKGGTGKTSLTGGLASCLALMGRRVLCLDADIGLRNLDITLGLSDLAMMDFTDVIAGHCTLEAAAVQHPMIPGLHLLTAPISTDRACISTEEMRALLREIKSKYDCCLIDSPAGIGSGFRLAACGADRTIVVTTTEAASLRDAQRTVSLLKGQQKSIHLVVNRVRPKLLRQLRTTIDDAMDTAGLPLLGVVPEDVDVTLAANRGIPLVLTSSRSAVHAYLNIARRLNGERVPLMRLR